jgi:DNA-directed RNA polymerase subunit RPC12/RpoP
VNSQRQLKILVEKDLRAEEIFRVGGPRLRQITIDSGLADLEIHCRESDERRSLVKCPVCGERLRRLRNMTVFGGTVTLGYRCSRCGYWTGLRKRVPTRYIFTRRI